MFVISENSCVPILMTFRGFEIVPDFLQGIFVYEITQIVRGLRKIIIKQ